MADFFSQLQAALQAGEAVYGDSFTISSSLIVFKGVLEEEESVFGDEFGEYDTSMDGELLASKQQFIDEGVVPSQGDTITINSTVWKILKVNEDKTAYQMILRK